MQAISKPMLTLTNNGIEAIVISIVIQQLMEH